MYVWDKHVIKQFISVICNWHIRDKSELYENEICMSVIVIDIYVICLSNWDNYRLLYILLYIQKIFFLNLRFFKNIIVISSIKDSINIIMHTIVNLKNQKLWARLCDSYLTCGFIISYIIQNASCSIKLPIS